MTNMIERVAQAIYASNPFPDGLEFLEPEPWRSCIYSARAAIAAMREPTKEMEAMGWAYHSEIGRMELPAAYTRMIDAALECSTKSDGK